MLEETQELTTEHQLGLLVAVTAFVKALVAVVVGDLLMVAVAAVVGAERVKQQLKADLHQRYSVEATRLQQEAVGAVAVVERRALE